MNKAQRRPGEGKTRGVPGQGDPRSWLISDPERSFLAGSPRRGVFAHEIKFLLSSIQALFFMFGVSISTENSASLISGLTAFNVKV